MDELILMAQAGDEDAFTKMILYIKDDLYKIAKTRIANETDIEDAIKTANEVINKLGYKNTQISNVDLKRKYINTKAIHKRLIEKIENSSLTPRSSLCIYPKPIEEMLELTDPDVKKSAKSIPTSTVERK